MLTAQEARKLAGPTLDEKVESLLKSVEEKAKEGQRKLATGYSHKEDNDLWINGGYSRTDEWVKAKTMLENLGYKVSFFYEEHQLVDMYTLVEW